MRPLLLSTLLALAPACAPHHPPPPPPPNCVAAADLAAATVPFDAFMAALRQADWDAAARTMHPDELKRLRDMVEPVMAKAPPDTLAAFGVADAAALDALTPEQFFSKFMGFITQAPGIREVLTQADAHVLGAVPDGPDRLLLVYRTKVTMQGVTVDKLAVTPVLRNGSAWALGLSGDLESLVQALQQRPE